MSSLRLKRVVSGYRVQLHVLVLETRDYKGDREGIPHIHPIP